MSNRTIIEINHDHGHSIIDNPDEFMAAISRLIRQGSNAGSVVDDLAEFGITVTPTAHHSEDRRVIIGNYFDREL